MSSSYPDKLVEHKRNFLNNWRESLVGLPYLDVWEKWVSKVSLLPFLLPLWQGLCIHEHGQQHDLYGLCCSSHVLVSWFGEPFCLFCTIILMCRWSYRDCVGFPHNCKNLAPCATRVPGFGTRSCFFSWILVPEPGGKLCGCYAGSLESNGHWNTRKLQPVIIICLFQLLPWNCTATHYPGEASPWWPVRYLNGYQSLMTESVHLDDCGER